MIPVLLVVWIRWIHNAPVVQRFWEKRSDAGYVCFIFFFFSNANLNCMKFSRNKSEANFRFALKKHQIYRHPYHISSFVNIHSSISVKFWLSHQYSIQMQFDPIVLTFRAIPTFNSIMRRSHLVT